MTLPNTTWLPNLVGGVSIWKLAPDLNEAKFFDGRLLVPDTEGSDSLPTRVAWNVAGLVPLAQARTTHAAEVGAAMRDFLACVEHVAKEFANPQSGYYKFKSAFTVPALSATAGDAAADANYFYSPGDRKLFVVNWGASPRDLSRKEEFIYGYDDFGRFFERAAIAEPVALTAAAARSFTPAAAAAAAVEESAGASQQVEPEAEKKVEEKKKGRAWWWWVLLGVAVLAILLLLAWLLQRCGKEGAVAADAGADAAMVAADGAAADAAVDAGADAAIEEDAAADAGAVADAGEDAGEWRDGGAVGLADGGVRVRLIGKGGKEKIIVVPGGGGGGGGGGKGGAGAGGEGTDDKGLPHRSHFQPDAVHWRVSGGLDQLDPQSPRTGEGTTFDVTLRPGGSFGSVKVQWQDKNGRWHN
ncbi:hypothetical protein LZC95_37220 [Pendulispora brunnea]|uniref:Uncharacterized protein n=1 Tax=Pendulispora brunnea TaxID=2905690 RepID=A0ABZ2K0F5_9BACT